MYRLRGIRWPLFELKQCRETLIHAHHKPFTKENQPPAQRQNGQFCQFLGWTIPFPYGIINPITRRFPSLHVQPIFPGVGHVGITFGFFSGRVRMIYKNMDSVSLASQVTSLREAVMARGDTLHTH